MPMSNIKKCHLLQMKKIGKSGLVTGHIREEEE